MTAVLVVAAGRGTRLGADLPKQYLDLGGQPVLRRTLSAVLSAAAVTTVRTVIHPEDADLYAAATRGLSDPRLGPPVPGGATRAASVRAGLEALAKGDPPDTVLIHDAARPFLPQAVIAAVLAALATHDGAIAALPVVDALWRGDGHLADSPVPRDGLWRAQTPQGFRFDAILAAHRAGSEGAADDAEIARAAGLAVALVPGADSNYKITTAADLDRARADIAAHPR
ncbi:2-C-methyl-D-erythritol 4-phosphate cytidylyltransferase [Rhodobacterales bacterium HKCCE2091]|nr:2-C-methyl-D-erythritol 4-phosphate cytidylyltransferase [Rhodobacterales bacterium HKCCE2091]